MQRVRTFSAHLGTFALGAAFLGLFTLGLSQGAAGQTEAADPGEAFHDEVLVTASKRTEDIQSVSLSITAIEAETLDLLGAYNLADLPAQVPNLYVSTASQSHSPFLFIRGLGTSDFNQTAQGSVGVYQDEVYRNSTAVQLPQLLDLEQVEVLRGPQSTLYGRNTTGGAIHLITRKPSSTGSFRARGTFGSYDLLDFTLAGGNAVGERAAFRAAATSRRRDGILTDLASGENVSDVDTWAARFAIEFQPGDRQSWRLSLEGSGVDQQARNRAASPSDLDRWDVGEPWTVEVNDPGADRMEALGTTVTGSVEFADFNLTSITSYLTSERQERADVDLQVEEELENERFSDATQWSQELRLTSTHGGRLSWLAGAHWFQEDLTAFTDFEVVDLFGFISFFSENEFGQENQAAAAYGQGSWEINDRSSLTFGLRYTWEEKDFHIAQQGFFGAPLERGGGRESWTEPTGFVGFEHGVRSGLLWYGKLTHGFRSGGFNAGGGVGDPAFDPELVDSLETGLKWSWTKGRLAASAFHSRYKDMQVLTRIVRNGIPDQILTNAGEAEITGLEAELVLRPTRVVSLSAGLGWLDTTFEEFIDTAGIDRAGNALAVAPEISLNGLAELTIPLAGRGELAVALDWTYRDKIYFDFENTERIAQDALALFGGRLSWRPERGRFEVAVWGRNLGDELYATRILLLPLLGRDQVSLATLRRTAFRSPCPVDGCWHGFRAHRGGVCRACASCRAAGH